MLEKTRYVKSTARSDPLFAGADSTMIRHGAR
jgi:hypothetical protein